MSEKHLLPETTDMTNQSLHSHFSKEPEPSNVHYFSFSRPDLPFSELVLLEKNNRIPSSLVLKYKVRLDNTILATRPITALLKQKSRREKLNVFLLFGLE